MSGLDGANFADAEAESHFEMAILSAGICVIPIDFPGARSTKTLGRYQARGSEGLEIAAQPRLVRNSALFPAD